MLLAKLNVLRRYQALVIRIVIWILSEIVLNYAGIDELADYSEFLFDRHLAVSSQGCEIG